ncbi:MAG: hypothetical protein D3914_07255 [Candidatus Electrothrix sp. LOE2]|nr:hypothetical protein [Candidatus Electrothrix sp. LOE2]
MIIRPRDLCGLAGRTMQGRVFFAWMRGKGGVRLVMFFGELPGKIEQYKAGRSGLRTIPAGFHC